MSRTALPLLLAAGLAAQTTVAPTPERAGPPRGEDVNGYNVVNSFETGYRFHSTGGEPGKYRSDVNYGNGIRLLGGFLSVHSKEGQGGLFDEIVVTAQGLGNDPYQFASLRIQKNKLYRYDLTWRLNEYYNPALAVANGRHFMNTSRRLQDHDFTLFPQSRFRLFAGYSRNSQDGPALTTVQQFNSSGDVFPLLANLRRLRNEYRLGGEVRMGAMRLNVLRGWDDFKEDTPIALARPSAGDATALESLLRREPYHGTSPYWRVGLFTESGQWFAANGGFTYVMGRRNFVFDETAAGTDNFGAARSRQTLVSGNGRRPVSTGHLTLSLLPLGRLTVANHTSFYDTRMEGDSSYQELNNATLGASLLLFRFLGIRTLSNTTDATLRATRWLSLYGGYQYSTRRIRTVRQFGVRDSVARGETEQDNRIHAGLAGIRLQPLKPLAIRLDAEIGRADHPFYPVAEKNYQALGARVEYRTRSLQLSAAARSSYNFNAVTLTSYSMQSRVYSFDASWAPLEWVSFDAGYAKRHLNTVSGIAYFAAGELVRGDHSIYISNLHTGNLGARIGFRKRADLYLGYSHAQDLGDGRDSPLAGAAGSQLPVFLAAQTFPVAFRSPQARLSIRLHERLRWNVGYQHYGYNERFFSSHGYRAHTGYTSVLWSF